MCEENTNEQATKPANADGDGDGDGEVAHGMIRLVSGDGFSFTVEEEYVMLSVVIRRMMTSAFKESITRVVHLPDIDGCVLDIICRYFYYIARFHNRPQLAVNKNALDAAPSTSMDSFAETFNIPPEVSVDVLIAARYLAL